MDIKTIEYCKKIGLENIEDILEKYTFNKVRISDVEKVINVLKYHGFNRDESVKIISKCPTILYIRELNEKIKQIKEFVSNKSFVRFPTLLSISYEKLKERVEYFKEIFKDYKKVINKNPTILAITKEKWEEKINFLRKYIEYSTIIRAFEYSPSIITYSTDTYLEKINFLKSIGANLEKMLKDSPAAFTYSVESLKEKKDLIESYEIDVPKIINKFPKMLFYNKKTLKEKIDFLVQEFGSAKWIVEKYPTILYNSVERMKEKLNFYLNEMCLSKEQIVELMQSINVFGYSLENRIRPRYLFFKEKNLKILPYKLLAYSDKRLMGKYYDEYKKYLIEYKKNNKNA